MDDYDARPGRTVTGLTGTTPQEGASGGAAGFIRGIPWGIWLALLAGLLLRLWFVLRHAQVAGDTLVYGDIARNMLEHHVYGFSQTVNGAVVAPRPTLIRLPGYPLFLALCFRVFGVERYLAVMLVQTALDLCSCLLLGGVAARLFTRMSGRARLAAVWLGALCPFMANYVAAPLTETLTLFCIALAFYALARWADRVRGQGCFGVNRWLFCLGFALAYAILLRPEQGLLAAAVVPAVLWIGMRHGVRALTPVLLLSLLTVLPLGPWAARNWHTFHVIQPLAPRFANDPGEQNPSGFQRWYRTWAIDFASTDQVYWRYDGVEIQIATLPDRAFDSADQYDATRALLEDYNVQTTSTPELDRRFNALGEQRIHAGPLRYYAVLPVARVLNMAFRPRVEMLPVPDEWWKFRGHWRPALFASAYALLNLAYFVPAGITLARPRRWRGSAPLVWSMVATIWLRVALLLTLDNSEPRYTLEFFPVLIVLAAGAILKDRA